MVAIFFWFYSKPDSIVILDFELKKDFLLFGTIECTLPAYLYGHFPAKGTV